MHVQLFDGWLQEVYEPFSDGIFPCSGLHSSHGGHFTSVVWKDRKYVTVTSTSRGPLHFLLQTRCISASTILEQAELEPLSLVSKENFKKHKRLKPKVNPFNCNLTVARQRS